jgi:hypothetical protein
MQDIEDEINDSIWCELGYRLVFDPLGKFVHGHQYVGEAAWRHCEGPNYIEALASEDGGMVIRL